MVQNSKFAIRILEKIGAPLAAALESVPLKVDDKDVEAAKLMAQMMGQTVQVSIALNNSLNVTENEEQADSTRLALAALCAPIIGEFYRQNARVPDEQDLKRIVKSQEAVLAFADNFSAADDDKSRLTTIDHDAPLFDDTQMSLVVLQTMAPVINAIFEFPFGQSEAKLLQDISSRLQKDASEIAKSAGSNKIGEVMALKALANLYAECHRMETARLANASDENRGELSLDPVWETYSTKLTMVEVLIGKGASTETNAGFGQSPIAETPPREAALSQEQTPPLVAPPAQEVAPATVASSPMGFFKPGGKTQTPAAVPPQSEAPSLQRAEEASDMSPPNAPLAETPPVETAVPDQASPPSSPMGFFKPGAKKADDT